MGVSPERPLPRIVLASTSPFRRRVLADVGITVDVCAPGVDEDLGIRDPVALVRELAARKAVAVAALAPDAWVIGADQVIYDPDHGLPWGKPATAEQHLARLTAMRGRPHLLVTGFALAGPGFVDVGHEHTRLHVRADLTDEELAAYVATGEGSSCAGGYAAEGRGAFLFERVEGDWFNVLGLPVFRLMGCLRARGWRFGEAT